MTEQTAPDMPASPPLQGRLAPYLMLEDAGAAIDFYKQALGAEEVGGRFAPEGKIVNSRIDVNGASIMLMDPMPEHGHPFQTPAGFTLHLVVDDADRWYERFVAAGEGTTTLMAPADQFWGDRYASVRDRFGVSWSFGSPLEK